MGHEKKLKRYTFCYSKNGYITVEAYDEDEAERLADIEEINWDDSWIDHTMTIEDDIDEEE